MAANWPKLPVLDSPDDLEEQLPEGWRLDKIENLYEQLSVGKRFDQKSSSIRGKVPVIDQSEAGFIGWHDEEPGVVASDSRPVLTFANHTCEMRLMRRPFSVIQNVFPLVGRTEVCDTRFLYYGTKGRVHLEEYKGHFPDYRRQWIPVPPLPEQRRIAHILGTLDDKIENNRKTAKTLEAMAQAIFKSWFVDFDPVRAKMAGESRESICKRLKITPEILDLFPDRLVDSELGEIPEGWEVSAVADHSHNFNSQRVPLSGGERSRRKGPYPYHGAASIIDYIDDYVFDGTYLLIGEDGSVITGDGNAVIQLVHGKFWVSNHAHVLQGKPPVTTIQLYLFFKFASVRSYITGAVQPKLSLGRMNSIPFIFPEEKLCSAFNRLIQSVFNELACRSENNNILERLRNALLPKLISGEIRVPDAEHLVETSEA